MSWRWKAWPCQLTQLLLCMTVLATVPAYGQGLTKDDGEFTSLSRGEVWAPPQRFGEGGVLALTFVGGDYLVVAKQDASAQQLPATTLSFYARRGRAFVETHRLRAELLFTTMYAIDDNRLVTNWTRGAASRTGIFAVEKGGVRLLLWLSWVWPPMFVDLDGDGEDEVIYAVPRYPQMKGPETAKIYKWTGRDYHLLRTVPWPERFRGDPNQGR